MTVGEREVTVTKQGILFDIDGTLIFSKEPVERVWGELSQELGIDLKELLAVSHGRRTIETLAVIDPGRATLERAEELENRMSTKYAQYAKPINGVHELIKALPASQWAVVTSGTRKLASNWFNNFLHIPIPEVFVTAESVTIGKPNPACYELGAKLLGLDSFFVFEDAPAGIMAGKGAGGTVVALATTYDVADIKAVEPDYIIKDMTSVTVDSWNPDTKELTLKLKVLDV